MAFKIRNFAISPLKNEEPKNNLEYTTKNSSGISDSDYAKYFEEGSIHRPNLEEVDLGAINAKKKVGESLVDTSKGSSFPTGASTETLKKWYANNPLKETINKVEGKKGLSGMKEGGKEFIQDLKTLTGNPFDGVKAVLRTNDSGGDFPTSLQDLKSLQDLSKLGEDGEKLTKLEEKNKDQAQSILSRGQALNTASAFLPPVLAADTAASLISGDPVAAILKKGKYFKPLGKLLKKSNFGKSLYDSLDEIYYGYKGAKKLL